MRFRFAITPIRFIFRIQTLDDILWDTVIFWIRFLSVIWDNVSSWIRYRTTYHEQDMTSGVDRAHIVISRNEWTRNITFRIFSRRLSRVSCTFDILLYADDKSTFQISLWKRPLISSLSCRISRCPSLSFLWIIRRRVRRFSLTVEDRIPTTDSSDFEEFFLSWRYSAYPLSESIFNFLPESYYARFFMWVDDRSAICIRRFQLDSSGSDHSSYAIRLTTTSKFEQKHLWLVVIVIRVLHWRAIHTSFHHFVNDNTLRFID